jgi:hypothetical protein
MQEKIRRINSLREVNDLSTTAMGQHQVQRILNLFLLGAKLKCLIFVSPVNIIPKAKAAAGRSSHFAMASSDDNDRL